MRPDVEIIEEIRASSATGTAEAQISVATIELLMDIRYLLGQICLHSETTAILAERTFPEALRVHQAKETTR